MSEINSAIQRKLVQKALNQLSEEDCVKLDSLINHDEKVKEYWEETLESLKLFGTLPDVEESWRQMEMELNATKKKNTRIRIFSRKFAAIAAILLLLICASFFYLQFQKKHISKNEYVHSNLKDKKGLLLTLSDGRVVNLRQKQGSFAEKGIQLKNDSASRRLSYNVDETDTSLNTLQVPAGLDYRIDLSDGSEIVLNSATKITFPFHFTGNSREITLDGEAYLKVAHNPQKPFIVHLPTGDVKVLGTEFNVNTYSNQEKVSLVKGSVRFNAGKDSAQLKPGQAVIVKEHNLSIKAIDMDELSWINGKYMLNNTSIKEIAELIPRWFGIEVKIDNKDISQRCFTGIIYKNKPIAGFLELLKGTNDAQYYYDGAVLHFK